MENFLKEAIREIRTNQENLNLRLRDLEIHMHIMRENEISRRVSDNEKGVEMIRTSFRVSRAMGGALIALLMMIISAQSKWGCDREIKKNSQSSDVQTSGGKHQPGFSKGAK